MEPHLRAFPPTGRVFIDDELYIAELFPLEEDLVV